MTEKNENNVITVDFSKEQKSEFWTTNNINYDLTSYNISFEGIDNLDGVVTVPVTSPEEFDWNNTLTLGNTGSITVTFGEDETK